MYKRFRHLPPLVQAIITITLASMAVIGVTLWLFPEWRTQPFGILIVIVGVVLAVAALFDQLSGARGLFETAPEPTPPPGPAEPDLALALHHYLTWVWETYKRPDCAAWRRWTARSSG